MAAGTVEQKRAATAIRALGDAKALIPRQGMKCGTR